MSFLEVLLAFQITTGTQVQQRKNVASQELGRTRLTSNHIHVVKFFNKESLFTYFPTSNLTNET